MVKLTEKPEAGKEQDKGDENQAAPQALPSHLLDQVEVTLEALLGSCEITLEHLASLKAGDSLTLDKQINEAVELRMNGSVIGHGEIVAVDGKFGVRLTKIGQ